MARHKGHQVSASTGLRIMGPGTCCSRAGTPTDGVTSAAGRAAFLIAPVGPNQVWQLDFS